MKHIRLITITIAALALAPAAGAQTGPGLPGDMAERIAHSAGSLNTVARLCGHATAAEAEAANASGRAQLKASGFDLDVYDRGFAAGKQETTQRWAAMSAGERKQACDEVAAAGEAIKQGAAGRGG